MTRIFLIRHGATTLSAEDRFAGETNVPLSDEGRAQAAALGERLRHSPIAAVYCSPLDRAVDTAALIAAPHGLVPTKRVGMQEISHGRWEGLTRHEVMARYPEEAASWDEDPYTFAPEGGESGLAVIARAMPAWREIVQAHPGQHIAIVSHKATIRLLLSALLGFDPRRYRDNLDMLPAALNIVDSKGPTVNRLSLFNDVSHYFGGVDAPAHEAARLSPAWQG